MIDLSNVYSVLGFPVHGTATIVLLSIPPAVIGTPS
ncbi:MAG: hypothetical protein KatS3mg055_3808 [Chloroflexus sp.]|nr:MAG: hypothetical protein KatS3mg055_3177 [Chloroflexus sp.]GIV91290.1 MAG: hypothetical protein KatS3mg055_3808 [Chloroflexus sp.]